MTDVDQRAAALDEIAALARRHGFTADEIAAAMTRTPSREDKRRGVLVRVLGFLGGTFVFAGVAVFIALQWDSMNSAARVVVTLGSGLASFAMGVIASRDPRFEKATTPLLVIPFAYFIEHDCPHVRSLIGGAIAVAGAVALTLVK